MSTRNFLETAFRQIWASVVGRIMALKDTYILISSDRSGFVDLEGPQAKECKQFQKQQKAGWQTVHYCLHKEHS